MVGVGLTMEGEEGNEIMYDLLLDQAWDKQPINTGNYFRSWVDSRYHGASSLPNELYYAWNLMRKTVYNNTNLAVTARSPLHRRFAFASAATKSYLH